jgi:hypothetical protein
MVGLYYSASILAGRASAPFVVITGYPIDPNLNLGGETSGIQISERHSSNLSQSLHNLKSSIV